MRGRRVPDEDGIELGASGLKLTSRGSTVAVKTAMWYLSHLAVY